MATGSTRTVGRRRVRAALLAASVWPPRLEASARAYDGHCLTSSTWSGSVFVRVCYAHDDTFRVKTQTVVSSSGDSALQLGYDGQGLLVCASTSTCNPAPSSALRITYASTHGLPTI